MRIMLKSRFVELTLPRCPFDTRNLLQPRAQLSLFIFPRGWREFFGIGLTGRYHAEPKLSQAETELSEDAS